MKNIISIILIVVSVGLFVALTNTRFASVQSLSAEVAQFDDALERSKELISLRDALLARYNSISSENISRISTMLPNSIDTVRLIIDINTLASRYNMSLANISVGVAEAEEGRGAIGPSADDFGTLSLSFTVTSTYERFRSFLNDLERSLRLADLTSLSFTAPTTSGLTTYSVTFNTYWLK